MLTLIVGGSGSGKSAYAEEYTVRISGGGKRYYLATMRVSDEEGRRRVEKHRRQRSGKGFATIELPTDIWRAADIWDAAEKTVLLECLSNLTANEMFCADGERPARETADKIVRDLETLGRSAARLVIVSNNVFEDGGNYAESTIRYLEALGAVNERLAAMADRVVEVVAGIPVVIKEGD